MNKEKIFGLTFIFVGVLLLLHNEQSKTPQIQPYQYNQGYNRSVNNTSIINNSATASGNGIAISGTNNKVMYRNTNPSNSNQYNSTQKSESSGTIRKKVSELKELTHDVKDIKEDIKEIFSK